MRSLLSLGSGKEQTWEIKSRLMGKPEREAVSELKDSALLEE